MMISSSFTAAGSAWAATRPAPFCRILPSPEGRRSHADPDGGSLPSADAGLAPAGALQRRGAAYEDLVTAGTYIAAPETAADYDQAVRYMLSQGENTLSLKYDQAYRFQLLRRL